MRMCMRMCMCMCVWHVACQCTHTLSCAGNEPGGLICAHVASRQAWDGDWSGYNITAADVQPVYRALLEANYSVLIYNGLRDTGVPVGAQSLHTIHTIAPYP